LLAFAEMFNLLGHCGRVVSPRDQYLKVDKAEGNASSRKEELAWLYRVCREQTADFTESFWAGGIQGLAIAIGSDWLLPGGCYCSAGDGCP
jgi:hypothetical protein